MENKLVSLWLRLMINQDTKSFHSRRELIVKSVPIFHPWLGLRLLRFDLPTPLQLKAIQPFRWPFHLTLCWLCWECCEWSCILAAFSHISPVILELRQVLALLLLVSFFLHAHFIYYTQKALRPHCLSHYVSLICMSLVFMTFGCSFRAAVGGYVGKASASFCWKSIPRTECVCVCVSVWQCKLQKFSQAAAASPASTCLLLFEL